MVSPTRLLLGLALAAALVIAARGMRSLSASGAGAALVVGTLAIAAGWPWGAALLAFFVPSSLLSRWRREGKERLTGDVVDKGGERDAWQVVANGGVFALTALGAILAPSPLWALAGLGALAGATADTWATEVGTAVGGVPRTLLGGHRVPPGTSGAVTVAGSVAMVLGATFLGTAAMLAGFGRVVLVPVIVGGVVGGVSDTLIGATVQARRWCPACERATERVVHHCGHRTEPCGGWAWLDNDVVNLASCIAGAAAALLFGRYVT